MHPDLNDRPVGLPEANVSINCVAATCTAGGHMSAIETETLVMATAKILLLAMASHCHQQEHILASQLWMVGLQS